MEYQTIANPDGTISIVPVNQQQGIMVPAYETSQLDLVNQINQGSRNIGAPMTLEETMAESVLPPDPRRFQSIFPTTGIMQQAPDIVRQAPTQNFEFDMANLPMYEKDDEQDQEYIDQVNQSSNKSGGILDLIMSIAVPGYGFLKNIGRGGLEGIRGLNQRIQQSDFGRSKTLADYFDARRYGGRDARDAAAARNMAQARGITKSLASRPSSTSGGYQKGPGGSGAQRTGASKSQSQAGPGFSGSGSAAEMGSF